MSDCATTRMHFETKSALSLEAAFDGGRITSDSGLLWLSEADSESGLCEAISEHVPEWRKRRGRHSLQALIRQRVFQIACGYEDQNDSDSLREDPLLKMACGSLPESGPSLASQPTFSRLENSASRRSCHRIAEALFELYLRERGKDGAPRKVLLDFDATDDPVHGGQEGSYYHGYYRQHMYHPLLVFDGETGHLVCALLRAGNTHASNSSVALMGRIVSRLRGEWPEVALEIRADAGFAVPALYDYCEAEGIAYTVGLITNPRLREIAEALLAEAQEDHEETGHKARLFCEDVYRAGSWERQRRIVYKAEAMEKGTNTRFVVTTRTDEPKDLYEFYAARGEGENWIKDFKLHIKADRLSCHRFIANQFRLLLHAAAYWLMDILRRKLVGGGARRTQLDTLRLSLIKIGGRVRELLTKVRLHLACGHPGQDLWRVLSLAFGSVHE
ncbi:MAG: IS1380 family transposase [Rubrobacteraceae bacterium]|nr:IS1380 family transposase [Rubrobacteraceae bacterium]